MRDIAQAIQSHIKAVAPLHYITKSWGLVTPVQFKARTNDRIYTKTVPYTCGLLQGNYDACKQSLERFALMSPSEKGIMFFESRGTPIADRDCKKGRLRYTASLRLVWIVSKPLIGFDCCTVHSLVTDDLLKRLCSSKISPMSYPNGECSGAFRELEIMSVAPVEQTPQNVFGRYSLELFQHFTCHPFDYGAIEIQVKYAKPVGCLEFLEEREGVADPYC